MLSIFLALLVHFLAPAYRSVAHRVIRRSKLRSRRLATCTRWIVLGAPRADSTLDLDGSNARGVALSGRKIPAEWIRGLRSLGGGISSSSARLPRWSLFCRTFQEASKQNACVSGSQFAAATTNRSDVLVHGWRRTTNERLARRWSSARERRASNAQSPTQRMVAVDFEVGRGGNRVARVLIAFIDDAPRMSVGI